MWHYAERGVAVGPVTTEELRARLASGAVTPATPVVGPGIAAWTPLIRTAAMPPLDEAARREFCRHCGRRFPPDALIPHGGGGVCGECKAGYFQRLAEGAAERETPAGTPAGFWIRAAARLIDQLLVQALLSPFALVAALLFTAHVAKRGGLPDLDALFAGSVVLSLLAALLPVSYEWWTVRRWAATPGKRLLGLRIIDLDGSPPSSARALARALARWLTALSGGIGYLLCLFDGEKRTLHDRIAGTKVVRA